jgi:sn-glycerol 3-phosphate transport system ATP-binding protein
MTEVRITNVSKQKGQATILDNINICIHPGEFVVIVGPSGCGKSTLLRLIAGLEDLSFGEIHINAQCMNHIPPAKRDMAMVFQNYALYPHMTVFDNMAYGLKMRRVPRAEIQKRVQDVAVLLKLVPYLDRKPGDLSGGQKQRVAMGRAIVRKPSVFLFDEPLSNLDAALRSEMRHEIKKLHQQFKTTSLYVTHDQTEAMTMAERILVLNQGRIEQIGSPKTIYQEPESMFVAGFMGHYPINFIEGAINQKQKCIHTVTGIEYPIPMMNQTVNEHEKIVVGIRPEHIVLQSTPTDKSLTLKVAFIDDMGADKLIQAHCIHSKIVLNLKMNAEQDISSEYIHVHLPVNHLHLFSKDTGQRLGDWREKS